MAVAEHTHETMRLTLTLPKDVVQHLREQVARGVYSSESDYVQSILLSETLFDPMERDELTQWMNSEGARRLEALHRDPSSGLTGDQAFEGLLNEESGSEERG